MIVILILAAAILIGAWMIENKQGRTYGFACTVCFAVVIAFLHFCRLINVPEIVEHIKANPNSLIVFGIVYLCAGAVWSMFKWFLLLKRIKNHLIEIGYEKLTSDNKKKELLLMHKPTVAGYTGDLTAWVAYWPLSLLRFALGTGLKTVAEFVVNALKRPYEALLDRVFRF